MLSPSTTNFDLSPTAHKGGHAADAFEVLVEGTFGSEHIDVFPEFGTEGRNLLESHLER